eukprot:791376_1
MISVPLVFYTAVVLCFQKMYIPKAQTLKRNNHGAIQSIQQCLHTKWKHKNADCKYHDKKIAKQVIEIYNSVAEQTKNETLINQMLNTCLHLTDTHHQNTIVSHIWSDVQRLSSTSLNYSLLIEIVCNKNDTHALIEVLQWIESYPHDHNQICTTLIRNGYCRNAIDLFFKWNAFDDVKLNTKLLKACMSIHDLTSGQNIIRMCTNANTINSNTLIEFYAHFGEIQNALNVFNSIKENHKTEITIGVLMKSYIKNKQNNNALRLYDAYPHLHNDIIHLLAVTACTNTINYEKGRQIHAHITIDKNIKIKNALIHFYGKCNDFDSAQRVFLSVPKAQMTAQTIGCMMQIYIKNELYHDAMTLYDSFEPLKDDISHLLALKACIGTTDFARGKQIHASNCKTAESIEMITTLIEFYGTFDDIETAQQLFDGIKTKNIVCIGAMMKAYLNCNVNNECVQLFQDITKRYGLQPNIVCYDVLLDAVTKDTAYHLGLQIHETLKSDEKSQWMLWETEIQTNLIHMYGKCGMLDACECILNEIRTLQYEKYTHEIRIWNAMIHAYGRNGDIDNVRKYLHAVQRIDTLSVDRNTFIAVINACSHSGNVEEAHRIWCEIHENEIKYDSFVITTLVDCFARKGYGERAYEIIVKYETCKVSDEYHPNDENMWISLLSGARNQEIIRKLYKEIERKYENNINVMSRASVLFANALSKSV